MIAETKDLIYVIQGVTALGVILWTWLQSRSKANQSDIKAVKSDVAELTDRITRVETVGGKDEMSSIHARITDIKADTSKQSGQLAEISATLKTIQTALIRTD